MARATLTFLLIAPLTSFASTCLDLFEQPLSTPPPSGHVLVSSSDTGSFFVAERDLASPPLLTERPGGRTTGFALGLTRHQGQDAYLETLLIPKRVLWARDAKADTLAVVDALLNSTSAALATSQRRLVVRTPRKDIFLQPSRWPALRPLLEIAYGGSLPRDLKRTVFQIQRVNYMNLKTGWQLAVTPESVIFSNRFMDSAETQARRNGTRVGFTLHHHRWPEPSVQRTEQEWREAYSDLLRPTAFDLFTIEQLDMEWFAIRAFGTPAKPQSTTAATSRFFETKQIMKVKQAFAAVYSAALAYTEDDLTTLQRLEQAMSDLAQRACELHLPLSQLALYALGEREFEKLKQRVDDIDLFGSPEDFVFYRLFREWL